jgi:hypothetical protein
MPCPCKCARCESVGEFEMYFMRWDWDVSGYFAMCEECVENYALYVVEEAEDTAEGEDEE